MNLRRCRYCNEPMILRLHASSWGVGLLFGMAVWSLLHLLGVG